MSSLIDSNVIELSLTLIDSHRTRIDSHRTRIDSHRTRIDSHRTRIDYLLRFGFTKNNIMIMIRRRPPEATDMAMMNVLLSLLLPTGMSM
jgi:hypothetical protein